MREDTKLVLYVGMSILMWVTKASLYLIVVACLWNIFAPESMRWLDIDYVEYGEGILLFLSMWLALHLWRGKIY